MIVFWVDAILSHHQLNYVGWRVAQSPFNASGDARGILRLIDTVRDNGQRPADYMWRDAIGVFGKAGLCDEAYTALRNMTEKDSLVPNFNCWHRVVRAYAEFRGWEEGLRKLREMRACGVKPLLPTWHLVLTACAPVTGLRQTVQLLAEMKHIDQQTPNKSLWEQLVKDVALYEHGKEKFANHLNETERHLMSSLLLLLPSESKDIIVNSIVESYVRDLHKPGRALDFLSTFSSADVGYRHRTETRDENGQSSTLASAHKVTIQNWNHFLSLCGAAGEVEICDKALQCLKRGGLQPDEHTWAAMVLCYKTVGSYQLGAHVLEKELSALDAAVGKGEVGGEKAQLSLCLHLLLLELLSLDGSCDRCLEVLSRVEAAGLAPPEKCYSIVARALLKAGRLIEAVRVAEKVWTSVASGPIDVAAYYQPLVDALVAVRQWKEVELMLERLQQKGLPAFVSSLATSYILALATHGRADDALHTVERFVSLHSESISVTNSLPLTVTSTNAEEKSGNVIFLWHALLEGYAVRGLADEALWALEKLRRLKNPSKRADAMAWCFAVQALCKANRLDEARDALQVSRNISFLPTVQYCSSIQCDVVRI